MINAYQYEPVILRIESVYGRRYWVSKRRYYQVGKVQIPICTGGGLRRTQQEAI